MAGSSSGKTGKEDRNERLKLALRANLRRRKQQSKQKQVKDKPPESKQP